VTRVVLGTIAWRARLDFELARLTGRELAGIQPSAVAIMRIALFQMRFLDRVPAHAAVDTAVALAKLTPEAKLASGFINAVLRRASRERVELPPRGPDDAEFLALKYSHPRWMAARFIEWFGADAAERLMAANNEAAPNVLRLNLARGTRAELLERLRADGIEVTASSRSPETAFPDAAPSMDSRSIVEGLCYPQSEASQIVARMLSPAPGAIVADCAAAPGGKATHLAEIGGVDSKILALDLNHAGLRRTRDLARRMGHRNVHVVRADVGRAIPARDCSFDAVLLDAPCTGLGTLREHPEIRWRLAPEGSARMAKIQTAMLKNAARLVRAGGAIVYSVCSIAPEEGDEVIREFIARNPEFKIDPAPPNRDELADLIDADGVLRTRPDIGGLDGFFAVRMIRRN
jgi:16S rRNA (cytosine967-C5)-methyltransferase